MQSQLATNVVHLAQPEPNHQVQAQRQSKHACDRCRTSKSRCVIDNLDQDEKCQRCIAAQADCHFTPIGVRKRRKRTDARITSLEKELNSLKTRLSDHSSSQAPSGLASSAKVPSHEGHDGRLGEGRHSTSSHGDRRAAQHTAVSQDSKAAYEGILSGQQAAELFADFLENLLPQYPLLFLAPDESFDLLHRTKPLLLLAIVTAGGSKRDGKLFRQLHGHLVQKVTEKAIVGGQKTVELVQAILMLKTWYCPPDDLREMNWYQWTHIAGTMALELGLCGSTTQPGNVLPHEISQEKSQQWRTMLAVYQSCSS